MDAPGGTYGLLIIIGSIVLFAILGAIGLACCMLASRITDAIRAKWGHD